MEAFFLNGNCFKQRLQHEALHEKHKGHESMHAEMVLVLLITLIVSQVLLVFWRTRHFKSFQFATMIGMWLIPFFISLRFVHIRFLIIWTIFTTITVLIALKANRSPIERTTPRLLYKWFLLVHKISYILGIVGYIGLMMTFLGLNFLFFVSPTVLFPIYFALCFFCKFFN